MFSSVGGYQPLFDFVYKCVNYSSLSLMELLAQMCTRLEGHWINWTPPLGSYAWLTWSSADKHRLGAVGRAETHRTHHVVHLRVHVQLDHVGVADDCKRAERNASLRSFQNPTRGH